MTTVAEAPADRRTARTVGLAELAVRALVAAPDRLVVTFLAACVPAGLCSLFRVFYPALVIPSALIVAVAVWFVTPSRYSGVGVGKLAGAGAGTPTAMNRSAVASAFVGVFVLGWIWINHRYAAEYVVLQRDPGIYTLRGMWMVDHPTPLIDMSAESAAIAGVPGATTSALGFPSVDGTIYPQASGLVPALLGMAGWVRGLSWVLSANLLIGAVALISVYSVGRRVIGPLWALAPFTALAVCMPMIAFSRAPYSEPAALAAAFGGLLLLWIAWERKQWWLFLLAGLLGGVGSLARIDGGIALIGILAGFGVVTLGARETTVRRRAAIWASWFFLGAGLLEALGLLDSKINSPVYLRSQSSQVIPLTAGTVVAWVVVVAVAFVPLGTVRRWLADNRRLVGRIAFWGAIGIAVVLASRPLWWTARFTDSAFQAVIRNMQLAGGFPVDGARSYDESSVTWLALYLGPLTALLGAIGAAQLLARIVRDRDPRIAVFVMTVAVGALLYLNKISIFPDQIWAMRRFLPLIIPGLLIAAGYALREFAGRRPRGAWLSVGLAAALVAGSLVPWSGPVATTINGGGQALEMQRSCAVVNHRPVVLTGANPGSAWFLPTFKIGCGVPTVQYTKATAKGLTEIRENYGTDVAVVTFDPASVIWTTAATPPPTITTTITAWGQPLQRPPATAGATVRPMWIGTVDDDGRVTPVAPLAG